MTTTRFRLIAASAAMLSVLGCGEGLLDVETPDVIDPGALDNPLGIPSLHAGAVGEFGFALDNGGAGGPGLALYSALFTDEAMHASTPPATRDWDLRNVPASNTISPVLFLNLQRARARTEDAARRIGALVTTADGRIGELWALSAFTYILFGELYCSGVPISRAEPLTYGEPLSTTQLLDTALVRLTTAEGTAAGDNRILRLIGVLRGRALLNQGQFAQAAAAVAAVPTSYAYQIFHSSTTPRQTNQIPVLFASDILSVPNGAPAATSGEGLNGVNFATSADPRVPILSTGASRNDRVTPMVQYTRYTAQSDAVTYASGVEARLIEAEAALRAQNYTLYVQKLNQARSEGGVTGLPATLTDPGSDAARVDLLFRERAFWLYLTAHRLGDLRRLVRAPYDRDPETVFPTGAYHKQGLTRGRQVSFIVPQPEENNPEYDASACDPTRR
jgi:hypothetical protein